MLLLAPWVLLRASQRRGVRGGVCHEGPSPLLIRATDQRIMGINKALASSTNEGWWDTDRGLTPGCGTLTTVTALTAARQSRGSGHFEKTTMSIFKSSSPSSSSPWRSGCRPCGCRRDGQSSGRCCGSQNWSSADSSWLSWPSPLSGRDEDTKYLSNVFITCWGKSLVQTD